MLLLSEIAIKKFILMLKDCTVKPVLSGHSKRRPKLIFKTDYRLMQVKSIAECSKGEHSAILSTFINLPFVIKISVLSIFEWPLTTGFTIFHGDSFCITSQSS